jgi:NADH:ubiquinone oxidoreductase subunit
MPQRGLIANGTATGVPVKSTGKERRSGLDFGGGRAHKRAGLRSDAVELVLRDLKTNSFFTMLQTWLGGELVGTDEHGNRYYRERGARGWRKERRWVVFSRDADPTLVPTGWVGWLHKRIEKAPSEQPLPEARWEKERLPNLTGTPGAYLPPGALERGGHRAPATGDYEAWRPD